MKSGGSAAVERTIRRTRSRVRMAAGRRPSASMTRGARTSVVDKVMAMYRADSREMTGVYQTGPVAGHSLAADVPVATFGTLART